METEIVWEAAALDKIIRAWADQYTIDGKTLSVRNWCVDPAKNMVVFSFYATDEIEVKGE